MAALEDQLHDAALAAMVYETWLLNGATVEALPKPKLRRWVDKKLGRRMDWNPGRKVGSDYE